MEALERELVYLWYYVTVQLEQIFGWWVLGMLIGSAVSVFAKDAIHRVFASRQGKHLGIGGVAVAFSIAPALNPGPHTTRIPTCFCGT